MIKSKSPCFYGKRASLVLAEYRQVFLRNFQELESMGLATDLRVVGSVAIGRDTCKSDIDFLVKVKDDSMPVWLRVHQALADWIRFPVHITLERDGAPLPECMLRQAVPLEKWGR